MRMPGKDLFTQHGSHAAKQGQVRGLRQEVEEAPSEHVVDVDAEAWANALADKYAIQVPELRRAAITRAAPKQVTIRWNDANPFGWDAGSSRSAPGVRHVVTVPFDGEVDVFKISPSTCEMGGVLGRLVGTDTIVWEHEQLESAKPIDLDAAVDKWLENVERHLETWRKDVHGQRDQLHQVAMECIHTRQAHLQRQLEASASSTIPIATTSGSKTYFPKTITRKPGRARATRQTKNPPIPLVPALPIDEYEEAIGALRRGCRQMEKTPDTYVKLNEEERRNVLLAILNDGFFGVAGEAFNHKGKVDILVPCEGEDGSLFIGECKIWRGKEEFAKAIDQLFGYRTWVDSKLALIVFVPQKTLTNILKTARTTLGSHAEFAGWIDHPHEKELRCRVTWPGDPEKVGTLTVIFAHIPG
ncbi:MAG TPA: hypothetical protein VMN35_04635 [Gaiellaceae bacterium]|nr:hypothetical protein [Gaiellaceae bacterium]